MARMDSTGSELHSTHPQLAWRAGVRALRRQRYACAALRPLNTRLPTRPASPQTCVRWMADSCGDSMHSLYTCGGQEEREWQQHKGRDSVTAHEWTLGRGKEQADLWLSTYLV